VTLNVSGNFGTFRIIAQNMLDDIRKKLERVTPIGKKVGGHYYQGEEMQLS